MNRGEGARCVAPSSPKMILRLPPHLGLCEVDGRLLLLDLHKDRYFQLDEGSAGAIKRWRGGESIEPEALALLVKKGLLCPGDASAPASTVPASPRLSLLDQDSSRSSGAALLLPEVGRWLLLVRRELARGLDHAVAMLERRRGVDGGAHVGLHAERFRRARRLIPFAPNCLTDSLALSAFLARRRVAHQLVFGVKLDPFAAHCWLQCDDLVLNDAVDRVASFVPIKAI